MQIENKVSGAKEARKPGSGSGSEYARRWLARASVEDLVRVSRLLKHMCLNRETGDAYRWSVQQVCRITGYTDGIPGDYAEFDDALREGLRRLSEETNELNVCPVYRPGQTSCETTGSD
jgi:hypothetical protein